MSCPTLVNLFLRMKMTLIPLMFYWKYYQENNKIVNLFTKFNQKLSAKLQKNGGKSGKHQLQFNRDSIQQNDYWSFMMDR